MQVKNKKTEQAENTRWTLLTVAGELFAARGYAVVPLDEIVQRAELTKGALYHHFGSKQELFAAVLEHVLKESVDRIRNLSLEKTGEKERNSWKRLLALTELFLDSFQDRAVRQIVWVDGPAALGWGRWHAIVAKYARSEIQNIVAVIAQSGGFDVKLAGPLAQLFFGAVQEMGLTIAHAKDQKAARAELGSALIWMLEELVLRPVKKAPGKSRM